MDEEINFEILNAYVDGELDAAEVADVALAVANDSDLAHQVVILTRVRSALIEAVDVPAVNFATDRQKRSYRPLLAACVAFLVLTAGVLAVTGLYQRSASPDWFVAVASAHTNWPDDKADSEGPAIPVDFSGAGIFRGAFIPTLEAARLYITHINETTGPTDAEQIIVRYRGTRGCRITLFISTEALAFPLEKKLFKKGRQQAYAWRNGKYGYGVIAEGMDISRYQLIVETLYKAIRRYQPIDQETRVALGESRRNSVPCQV